MVYHSIRENLEKQGVIFLSSDDGLRQYPDIYKEYFGTVFPYTDNKFAAINTAVWPGGSFVYAPKGNFTGTDFFTYRAAAGTQLSNLVTVELKVSAVTEAPIAMAVTSHTPPGLALELMAPGVLANDPDPDGDALTAELVSPASVPGR